MNPSFTPTTILFIIVLISPHAALASLDSFFDQSVVTVKANKYLEELISKVKDTRESSKATEVRFKNASITIQENYEGGYSFFYETHEHGKIMKEGFAQLIKNKKKSDSKLFDPSIFE